MKVYKTHSLTRNDKVIQLSFVRNPNSKYLFIRIHNGVCKDRMESGIVWADFCRNCKTCGIDIVESSKLDVLLILGHSLEEEELDILNKGSFSDVGKSVFI